MVKYPARMDGERVRPRGIALPRPAFAWAALAAAMALAAAAILVSGRGTGFFFDEVGIYSQSKWDLRYLLRPQNGQLFVLPRLFYQVLLDSSGPDYALARIGAVTGVLAVGGTFFLYAKRRVGAWVALPPSVLLLFFGSGWPATLWPVGANFAWAIAAGIAALLLLERADLPGDAGACLLLLFSVGCSAAGLAFVAGAAVAILLESRRAGGRTDRGALIRRGFVVLVPLALFGAWFLWSLQFDQSRAHASNVLVIPKFVVDALGASLAAATGLNFGFTGEDIARPDTSLAPLLLALAVGALIWRLRRGAVPPGLWVWLAVLLAFWVSIALGAGKARTPVEARYLYLGAVGILAVAVEAVRGRVHPERAAFAGLALLVIAVPGNLRLLHDGGRFLREQNRATRAQLGMIELASAHVSPGFGGFAEPFLAPVTRAADYLGAAARFGPLGYSPAEVLAQPEAIRENADLVLSRALRLHLEAAAVPGRGCVAQRPAAGGGAVRLELRRGGATLEAADGGTLGLGRFAKAPAVELGTLPPDVPVRLRIPGDAAPQPWTASIQTLGPVRVCPVS